MAIVSGGALVLSDTTPTVARTNFYPNVGLSLTNLFASYGAIYRHQPWVFVVVSKRAKATARLPLKVYRRTDAGRDEARDDGYAQVLRRPNPSHDPFFFWLWTSSTFDIYGEAMWLKIRGRDGRPAELWPVHPSLIDIKKFPVDDNGNILPYADPLTTKTATFYAYMGALGVLNPNPLFIIPEADVVHFRAYNPDNTVRGMSTLEPLRQTIVNEDAARRATASFWKNGARPGTVLTTDKVLTDPQARRLQERWSSMHGGPDSTGNTAVLEDGVKADFIPLNLEEAQYVESRKLNREEVCAAYDIPPPVVHILDHATFSNITEQMRSMYRDTMAPHLGAFESTMDHQLRPEFGGDDLYAEFLMDEVLRGTFEERSEKIQAAVNSAQLTPNEARKLDNRPGLPGGDRLFINSTMVPIDEPRPQPGQPALPPAKGLTTNQYRTVMGRLGSAKSIEDVDRDRLCAGLNGMADYVSQAIDEATNIDDLRTLIKTLAGGSD